jgi:hypothetical protein
VPHGAKLRPVELLQTWLARAEISAGPVVPHVALGDKVSAAPLSTDAVARVVKKHACRLGLDPAAFAGHSLRSGFVTSAIEANAPIMKIAEQTRHRSLDMLWVYSQRADLFSDHAGSCFLMPFDDFRGATGAGMRRHKRPEGPPTESRRGARIAAGHTRSKWRAAECHRWRLPKQLSVLN